MSNAAGLFSLLPNDKHSLKLLQNGSLMTINERTIEQCFSYRCSFVKSQIEVNEGRCCLEINLDVAK